MSQASFIRAVLNQMDGVKVLDAVTKGLNEKAAFDNLKVYFDAHLDLHKKPIQSAQQLIDYAFNVDASDAGQARAACRGAAVEIITAYFRENPPTTAEIEHHDWGTSLGHVIRHDAVEALMKLDAVGLIDRSPAQVFSDDIILGRLHHCWTDAISGNATRCNRYLLTTASLSELAGFPRHMRTWPNSMEMARDIVAQIPEAELPAALAVLVEKAIEKRSYGSMDRHADALVPALLERCCEYPTLRGSEDFAALTAAVVKRSAETSGSALDSSAHVAVLDVLARRQQLASVDAFRLALKILKAEKTGGNLLSPLRLASLIDNGLPIRSEPGWFDNGYIAHLLLSANEKHFDVLTNHVPDKTAFMREFGRAFVLSNTTEVGRSSEQRFAENRQVMRLAELGYPFGPIDYAQEDGSVKTLALYETISSAQAAVPFVVGHLVGHLDAACKFDGAEPMHVAVYYHSAPTIEALAGQGFALDSACGRDTRAYRQASFRDFYSAAGMTPLVMALKMEPNEGAPLVMALINAGADVSIKSPTGASAMQLAKTPEIKVLLRSGRTGNALASGVKAAEPAAGKRRKKAEPGML